MRPWLSFFYMWLRTLFHAWFYPQQKGNESFCMLQKRFLRALDWHLLELAIRICTFSPIASKPCSILSWLCTPSEMVVTFYMVSGQSCDFIQSHFSDFAKQHTKRSCLKNFCTLSALEESWPVGLITPLSSQPKIVNIHSSSDIVVWASVCPNYNNLFTLNYQLISFATHMFFLFAIAIGLAGRGAIWTLAVVSRRELGTEHSLLSSTLNWRHCSLRLSTYISVCNVSAQGPLASKLFSLNSAMTFICALILHRTSLTNFKFFVSSALASFVSRSCNPN